jgi:predicted MPP superfamily phosphohydrolase
MRSYSFFTIILLCLAILIVDALAYYWLQSITNLIVSESLRMSIHVIFWFFTIGLITSILLLKNRLDTIDPKRKHLLVSSLYGLTISSFIPKLIFVIILSVMYFTNYVFSEKESIIILPLIGLFSGLLPFFIILYAIFKSLYRFKIHHVKIAFQTLPKNFDDLSIVHISDFHLGSFNYRYHILSRAVKLINELHPDYIFFTGDLVNNYAWELRGWNKIMKPLSAKKGKFAVLGNHDYGDYSTWESDKEKKQNFEKIKQFYDEIDFNLLLNESCVIQNEQEKIALIGVENWGKPPFKIYGNLKKAMSQVNDIPFKILLTHDPTHWSEEVTNETDISLTLSGHTHGMQAGVNIKSKKWSPIKYKYEHWAGLYENGSQFLYVNRGLGWLGFPGRLGMRPEITFMKLKSETT